MTKIRLMLAAALVCASGAAFAETRIFILENSDGYGVDACLANGEPCGETLASAWCRTHDYARAIDFGQVTGSIAAPNPLRPVASTGAKPACTGAFCPSMVAITCTR
ncbi:hypothetical protein [Aquabacter cavernae]|uniref:hypothetical protein n=1 Tax=Aquabacter cavernae TaxID=2496029 RepID=UPI000F8C46E2|nr:hypothetical protein [Aquabacter cavernae]